MVVKSRVMIVLFVMGLDHQVNRYQDLVKSVDLPEQWEAPPRRPFRPIENEYGWLTDSQFRSDYIPTRVGGEEGLGLLQAGGMRVDEIGRFIEMY